MAFLIFCIGGISTVCLVNLLSPFIELWVGRNYLLPNSVVYVAVANFFFMQNRWLVNTFKFDAGIFRPDMYKPLIEIVFNLSLSIFLVHKYGVLGVLIGTLANTFFINIWVEVFIAHKYIFSTNIAGYLKMYMVQIFALLISCTLSLYINSFVELFAGKAAVSISVAMAVYFLFFFRTEEFRYYVKLYARIFHGK